MDIYASLNNGLRIYLIKHFLFLFYFLRGLYNWTLVKYLL